MKTLNEAKREALTTVQASDSNSLAVAGYVQNTYDENGMCVENCYALDLDGNMYLGSPREYSSEFDNQSFTLTSVIPDDAEYIGVYKI